MTDPVLSIVTPVKDEVEFIQDTIESVKSNLLQDHLIEHIVVDGGSTDGTVDVLRGTEDVNGQYSIRWISEPDQGQTNALNRGIDMSNGAWVAWINADDFYLPGGLRRLARFAVTHPAADLVYGDFVFVDADGNELYRKYSSRPNRFVEKYWSLFTGNHCTLFQANLFDKIGQFDETLEYTMDAEFFWRITNSDLEAVHVPELVAARRLHVGTKTGDLTREVAKFVAAEHEQIYGASTRDRTAANIAMAVPALLLKCALLLAEGADPRSPPSLRWSIGAIFHEWRRPIVKLAVAAW